MFATSVSGEKMKNKKVVMAGVSLSEACALCENHPLSETSVRLASRENLSIICTLNASSAHSASRLSSLTLSAPSEKSLTRT